MKQGSFFKYLRSVFTPPGLNKSIIIRNFHLDLILPIFLAFDEKIFLIVPDNRFYVLLKYLRTFVERNGLVLIPPDSEQYRSPSGFYSQEKQLISRAQEQLAGGLRNVKTVVASESGMSIPLLGSGEKMKLVFEDGITYEGCENFLIENNYIFVEFVSNPGEYSLRGGIIDVFPKSAFNPCRINFLDNPPSIFRFDIDSQLTREKVENFILKSTKIIDPSALKSVEINGFIRQRLFADDTFICGEGAVEIKKNMVLQTLQHRQFVRIKKSIVKSIQVAEGLSSIAVLASGGEVFVPHWFVDKIKPYASKDQPVMARPRLDLTEIKRGDFFVHRDHGVGMCLGLKLNEGINGSIQEFLILKYDDGGIVFVDSSRLDLIGYYASSSENVVLSSLSRGSSWARKKSSAKKHAEKTVQHLLNLYINRNNIIRDPLLKDVSLEMPFINDFPFEDTPDQVAAWEDISKDLSSKSPMDRLICGDVGFGKTEIAIRAAFRVVLSEKRVVVLAPTTILANQLFSAFSTRLEPNAISVEMVSRFRSKKELVKIKNLILDSKNDVLIGTHALLNDDIFLNNIGLLVIDEEHRFGVRQKETIKRFKDCIDVLSMSATPIPRSMNLALTGIYSITMLQTPPLLRLPIITKVEYYGENIIKDAIEFEVSRGGQVFFVHNDIREIKNVSGRIQGWFPSFSITFIHGQEPSNEIERKMELFVMGTIDVLVCTSIIESGIDIPSANTIIINNSHLFGLSQLYQMRGRVGRGNYQAYAYLLIPKGVPLSENAYRRIKTIEKNTSLGSGYNISRSDMELRGSGTLFGYKQSGGGGSVGYEMYLRLIQRELYNAGHLATDFKVLPEDVIINLYNRRYIPKKYITIESVRMSIYKNLVSVMALSDIEDIKYNLLDRFGPLPKPLINILNEYKLRLLSASVGINSIIRRGCGVLFSIKNRGGDNFATAMLHSFESFFEKHNIEYHFMPPKTTSVSICVHLPKNEDNYSIVSKFMDKFNAWDKTLTTG